MRRPRWLYGPRKQRVIEQPCGWRSAASIMPNRTDGRLHRGAGHASLANSSSSRTATRNAQLPQSFGAAARPALELVNWSRPTDRFRDRRIKETPPGKTGRGLTERLSVGALARPRPEQRVTFAAFVIEKVGVDRRVERGIVELEREVVAALLGTLRPRCSDFCSANVHAVARSIVVGAVGLGDDADTLGLQAQCDDLTLKIVLGQFATVFLK